ncbi:hypothetical protein CGRA01v4_08244 [Colletotrichum graminicola]|uniref:Uncharacterized protein n=1 Tax=Colletotrichum graminicola (strain M1.001 / M2 / FGSC 10212) TaxID=645133 RepID=E3QMQ2_COLGM|nr:uncharacterized protein GLRG_07284 [Colletotrichum graminicola M1.001]EFQ32140.1 hypothetical protein GLRG_07284 [Colletotrichum graminicola M1.001]WDK16961.1 hypothetical protein CGRA01v4_08244 [Colletotrichum graminicola]
MKFQASTAAFAALLTLAAAEVPQEHSHEKYLRAVNDLLKQNNPQNIQDAVFGLLGNAAAADGAGDVKNLDCLHQATADSAFSTAKAAGDVDGMASALVYAAVERNTGKVGLKSVLCTDKAENPEIAALSQHQDPASEGAAETNKAITLELAKQLASVGADPQLALDSGTFKPGDVNDSTGAGNTCDDANDAEGCIFSQNLLVKDASADEIAAAAAEVSGNAGNGADNAANSTKVARRFRSRGRRATTILPSGRRQVREIENRNQNQNQNQNNNAGAATGTNVQTFTGALGGPAPPVNSSPAATDKPFDVNGSTFVNKGAALQRSCSVQNNACSDAANSGAEDITVADCQAQEDECLAAASLKKLRRSSGGHRMRIASRQALDFGSCQDPSIEFAAGLDGRKEESFAPAGDFEHGSALNINVISSFICGQLQSKCKADAAAVDACKQGQAAAQGQKGQAAADAFNSALGV